MKAVFLVLLSITAFVSFGQSDALFKNGSIKLEYSPTPQFYLFNKSAVNKTGSPGWLLVTVTYTTAGNKNNGKTLWLDDITMETELVIPASYQSRNVVALLKGKTIFWSIPLDGKKHQAMGCVPPQVIARFARKGNKIETSKMMARVTFYTSSRKILARIHSSSGNRVRDYFAKIGGAVSSGVLTVEDIVMPRTKTPWGVINYELFDLIKPDPQK
ncbi:MAG: hypothetical protein PHV82_01570 [Victivallaceae bacterium]|nr:hypothetical protein [Victivallaceae bacterium]